MKKLATFAASTAVSLAALTGVAMADEGKAPSGWYVSGGIGYNIVDDVDVTGGSFQFDDGYVVQGAIGYDTGDITSYGKFRIEAEIGYSENDNESITVGAVTAAANGQFEQTSYMVNTYIDFVPGGTLRPYLGVGLGFVDGDQSITVGGLTASGSGTEFAYRGLAGLSWHLDDNWALDFGYRFTAYDAGGDVENHALVSGIRYGF
jgi:opacity protein-like surface antigen